MTAARVKPQFVPARSIKRLPPWLSLNRRTAMALDEIIQDIHTLDEDLLMYERKYRARLVASII
jgi:hypothetical protein